ncbi:phosphatase PAP2 family protein [Hyalangium rubrum]|uniref:Phosphatase PAP2 family protein n=1 Tax=Hyalangium rubrum TaxID=3103134 RepID=A0ABU5GZI0_9BACT|nr:phosphatase PAP2 family protein [Hyalangium sp. s54d21]MDY7225943.1 phosphatase PAP2 family protein [Hyalangium sp. s54d21]
MWRPLREWSSLLPGPDGARLLVMLLVIVGCCLGFVVLADEVLEKDTQTYDEAIVRALRKADAPEVPVGPRWLRGAARDVTALGSGTVLTMVTLAVCGFLALVRHFRSLLLVAGSTVGGAVLNSVLKELFARPRPSVVPHLAEVFAPSFPSGHAMLSAIVYLTLGALLSQLTLRRRLKVYVLTVGMLLSFLVGLTRVFLGVHYLTDVLGGWMAGLAWALLCTLLVRAVKRRSPALREEVLKGADTSEQMPDVSGREPG